MAWIESHQSLRDHPKVARLARLLGIPRVQAIGMLHHLWWWALDHAEDGDLSEYDAHDIADAMVWDGDPELLVKSLLECGPGGRAGFIDAQDGRYELHNWGMYAGRLIASRRHHAAQKRKHRELYNDKALTEAVRHRDGDFCRYCAQAVNWQDRRGGAGATYDYVDPFGPSELSNVVVACRSCNAGKNQRTPTESGYRLLPADHWHGTTETQLRTDHDLHQQNLTRPNRLGSDPAATGGAPSRPSRKKPATRAPESFPVTDDLRSWATSKGLALVDLDAETEQFLDHHRAKDSAFSDWRAAWRTWMTRAQQYASERQRPGRNGAAPPPTIGTSGRRII